MEQTQQNNGEPLEPQQAVAKAASCGVRQLSRRGSHFARSL